MKNTYKRQICKTIVGISFSLLVAASGAIAAAPQAAHAAVATSSASVADRVIATGKQFLHVRYEHGAEAGRTDAFDCSSFTQYVFKQNGIDLPRSSRQQSSVGTFVRKSELKPGDLVFSDTNRDGTINHVAIYMGNDKLLHTYKVGIGVTISDFSGSTWDETYVTARRVIKDGGQGGASSQTPVKETTPQPAKQPTQPSVDRPSNDSQHPYVPGYDRNPYNTDQRGQTNGGAYDWFNQMFFNLY